MAALPNKLRRRCLIWITSSALVFFGFGLAWPLELRRKKRKRAKAIPVSKKDRCPVCGMFVHPFPEWITQIQFKDGSYYNFDGMKCLCRFYFDPKKYDPTKKRENISRILVRDYYTLQFIRHNQAFYVVGSDVLGPMGHELVPFGSEKKAKAFMADHNGVKIFRFQEITPSLLDKLDRAKKRVVLD